MIAHVSIEVRPADVPACERFWRLLGFRPVPAPGTLGERSFWLQRGEQQLHLLFAAAPVVPPEAHVAVVCADYEATLRALRAAGFDPRPRAEYWGAPRCFVTSPAGHRVEVMQSPPP